MPICTCSIDRTHDNADKTTVFRGFGAFSVGTTVQPMTYNPRQLAEDWVEIKIICCGICGSDLHHMRSGWAPANYPFVPGHEIVGTISKIGTVVTRFGVGDRVGVGAESNACPDPHKQCLECDSGLENYCRQMVGTYNYKYPDGQISQGGYADYIRMRSKFLFKLPEKLASIEAAPMMCGGITVFAPLQRYITRPNMKVGIIGIGGLGHMAVLFAVKMKSARVTAIGRNDKKKKVALELGAVDFLDTSDKTAMAANYRSFDLVLSTADGLDNDYNAWGDLPKLGGTLCVVGASETNIVFSPFTILRHQFNFVGSAIGSIKEIEQMLEFAAENDIHPVVQTFPMSRANDAIKTVADGSVRFRAVLEN